MGWTPTPYTVPLAVSVLVAGSLAAYTVRYVRRNGRDATVVAFGVLMGLVAYWSLVYALRLSSTDPGTKHLLHRLNFTRGLVTYAWLVFALAYTDRTEWLTPRRLALLGSYPVVYEFLITPTAPFHDLVAEDWSRYSAEAFFVFYKDPAGIGHVVVVWWAYVQGLAGFALFLWMAVTARETYREQSALVVTGAFAPLVVDGLFRLGASPHPHVELTSVSFTVSGVVFAVAIFRYRLLDLVPVARDRVVDSMRDGYVVLDETGRVVDHNPAATRLLTDGDDPTGRPIDDLLPAAANPDGGDRTREAVTVDPPDGPERFVEVDVSPLARDEGTTGRLVTLRDVTERRRTEERYQSLIEYSSDVIAVVDRAGRIEYASTSVERILGIEPGLLEGRTAADLVHPDDWGAVAEAVERLRSGPGTTTRVEVRVATAGGEYRYLEAVATNLLADPVVDGVVVNARDVTERRERERALRRQNERLDEFASVVSHDLRNPLSAAQGYLDLARTDPETHLPTVEDSLDRVEAIVDDVLALARQGETVTDPEPVALPSVAREAWTTVDTGAMDLVVAGDRTIRADRDRLARLFENLYRNAREHAGDSVERGSTGNRPPAGEAVTVSVGPTDGGFFVEDDGPGIPEDRRDRVLESGYTTASDGTGFGLAIVTRIAEAHGWTVGVGESEWGGARIEIHGVESGPPADERAAVSPDS